MSCDWEGNRRSGVALSMCHRLKWLIHQRAQGLRKGDEHPTNTLHGVWYSLPLPVPLLMCVTVLSYLKTAEWTESGCCHQNALHCITRSFTSSCKLTSELRTRPFFRFLISYCSCFVENNSVCVTVLVFAKTVEQVTLWYCCRSYIDLPPKLRVFCPRKLAANCEL